MEMLDCEITIAQYDWKDNEIARYSGTFLQVFSKIRDLNKYYYRDYYRVIALGKQEGQERVSTMHFGVRTTSIGGFLLTEESYVNSYLNCLVKEYEQDRRNDLCCRLTKEFYSFSYVLVHDIWYHNRMKTVMQNSQQGFNTAFETFLTKNKEFQQVEDLNDWADINGIYIMVLDSYNVCYIGQSDNIRRRIMRHWSRNDYFSGTGIDMFKAKDTTRIYAAATNTWRQTNLLENRAVKAIPSRYTLNCLAGGDLVFLEKYNQKLLKKKETESDFINYVTAPYDQEKRVAELRDRFLII